MIANGRCLSPRWRYLKKRDPFNKDWKNVRAWEYGPDGALRKEWETHDVNIEQISEVWFFIEPFAGNPLFAHSFLSFVFEDEEGQRKTLSVSVEARKEAGEKYSGRARCISRL